MRYELLLFKSGKLVDRQSLEPNGKATCKGQIYEDLPFGVEVKLYGDDGNGECWAEVKFTEGNLRYEPTLCVSKGYGALSWDSDLKHDMIMVICPARGGRKKSRE